jgi:succinoglycan biosynthesis transport protein ExoP
MSRIQNILEKAEREGSVSRLRATEPVGGVPAATSAAAVGITSAGRDSVIAANGVDTYTAGPATPIVTGSTVASGRIVVAGAQIDPRLVTAVDPGAVTAEQYRALRTRILHADAAGPINLILITSPGRGDGKTLTASNLALTMAQDHRRICLVEADMRNPRLQKMFGLPEGPGLSDILTGEATLDDALLTLEEHEITILPAGRVPGHPAELLGTTAMRRNLETLRSQFDRVIIDAPAATPLADVGILMPLVDRVLLVVRAGVTAKPAIHDAVDVIDPAKLLGLVLNEVV